ncbi:MAG TPA: hypothetical protein VNO79_03625 [Actinomycetota bacterium]|nr:hypothetical protein [Actinomycetota bacterium]
MQDVASKIVVTPLLIGAASLAGRRWGHHVGGWLVGLPTTTGLAAFFLAADHGTGFAGDAAVGMLAGTSSQAAFAVAYRAFVRRGWPPSFAAGCAAFTASTVGLARLPWSAWPTFALVVATLAAGYVATRPRDRSTEGVAADLPRWDIPVRMGLATAVVLTITGLAPIIGAHLAGLLAPFPVFGSILAVFTHRTHGPRSATAVLHGFVVGLGASAVFFLVLALTVRPLGPVSFAIATLAAVLSQAGSVSVARRRRATGVRPPADA